MKPISIDQYFCGTVQLPLLDVRSPSEFANGHIPGAMNLPLFEDLERAEVGTLYKQRSKEVAMLRGLEIAGKKITFYVKKAKNLVRGKEVVIHCWRGGMRSASMATLLEFMGSDVFVLEGGYKSYRRIVLNSYANKKLNLFILGGKTGSGKTEVLKQLELAGEQVIDLEGLANHKGSAFGSLGEDPQPTVEQFENNLYNAFRILDIEKRIWVENESKSIGRVYVPDGFWAQMGQGILAELEVGFDHRVNRLVDMYGHFSKEELVASLQKISKRMGGQNVKKAIESYESGDLLGATKIALLYYDKAYQHATDKKTFECKFSLKNDNLDPTQTASKLIELANEYERRIPKN